MPRWTLATAILLASTFEAVAQAPTAQVPAQSDAARQMAGSWEFTNADRAVTAGAGLSLMPADLSPDAVRSALRRLLEEPNFARRAAQISDEMADMPPPQAAVAALEQLVLDGRQPR